MRQQVTSESAGRTVERQPTSVPREIFRFGNFELRTNPERLLKQGRRVPLQPQPAKALVLLLTRAGAVVTREELRDHLWGASFLEYDQGINFAIRKIRMAIEDDPAKPRMVETIPKLGYRFVAAATRESQPGPRPLRTTARSRTVRRMAGLALLLVVLVTVWQAAGSKPTARADLTVAVLPWQISDLSPTATAVLMGWSSVEPEAAADGLSAVLTEEWIAELAGTFGTRASLIAMDPAARHDASDASLVEAAATLEADLAVRGRVSFTNGAVYLVLRALRVSDRVSVWTHRSRVDGASRAAVLSVAAREVREALGVGGDPAMDDLRPSVAEETYSLYLRGRYLTMSGANSNNDSRINEGIDLLERVVASAPDFGRAHAALAHAHLMRIGLTADERDIAGARDHGQRALSADASLAEAHVVLGALAMYCDHDWNAARSSFERALSLQPGLSKTYRLYGAFLSAVGEHDAAVGALRRAVELDPTSSRAIAALAEGHMFARQYTRAIEAANEAAEAGPFNSAVRILGAHLLLLQGNEETALAKMNQSFDAPLADLDQWHLELARHLSDIPVDSNASHGTQAIYYVLMRDTERALDALERATASAADVQLPFAAVDPRLDPLRIEPRFAQVLSRLGLPTP